MMAVERSGNAKIMFWRLWLVVYTKFGPSESRGILVCSLWKRPLEIENEQRFQTHFHLRIGLAMPGYQSDAQVNRNLDVNVFARKSHARRFVKVGNPAIAEESVKNPHNYIW